MRIGIDICSTLKNKTGIEYYTLNLINNLAKVDKKNQYLLYSKKSLFNKKKKIPPSPAKNFKHIVDWLKISPRFRLKGLNVFHTSNYALSVPPAAKFVLVVHDVIHKAYPLGHQKNTNQEVAAWFRKTLPKTDKIITFSVVTKKDLIKFYNVREAKIEVVYPGVNKDIFLDREKKELRKQLAAEFSLNSNYILYVGTIEPRKNVEGLIKSYKILKDRYKRKQKLVIAGMKGWLCHQIEPLIKELGLSQEVILTGYITREELSALYQCAEAFVYPSFYEGFGMPILEAFSFRVPVITANISATAEVAADAALLVDPNNYQGIADAIENILGNIELRKSLINKGEKRLLDFSWEKTAKETLEVFKECINEN